MYEPYFILSEECEESNNPVTGTIPQGDMSCGIVPFGMIVILFRN